MHRVINRTGARVDVVGAIVRAVIAERVAVQVRRAAACAHMHVAAVRVARLLCDLADVGVGWPNQLPTGHHARHAVRWQKVRVGRLHLVRGVLDCCACLAGGTLVVERTCAQQESQRVSAKQDLSKMTR